jgi:hypothetical protein
VTEAKAMNGHGEVMCILSSREAVFDWFVVALLPPGVDTHLHDVSQACLTVLVMSMP